MKSIHRLNLPVTDYQEITGHKVISAALCRTGRSDFIDVWFEAGDLPIGLYIIGTGNPVPWDGEPDWCYRAFEFISTVVTPSGPVWHVYTGPIKVYIGQPQESS